MRTALIVPALLFASLALAGERARIVREVPHHDLAVVADCTADAAAEIQHEIQVAISLGAPTYNAGDFEGCYRVYSNTALALDARVPACTGLRKALLFGVERARKLRTFDEKAWAMRDAFDGVLDVIDRADFEAPAPAPAVERHVPRYPARMLEDCAAPERARVVKGIEEAIEIGAPVFNEGKPAACARVYQLAALELQSSVSGCVKVKRALEGAVNQSRDQRDAVKRAWLMRDVFDGVLEVIGRKGNADEI